MRAGGDRSEAVIPYSYATPASHGHGTIGAAAAAIIADLETGSHYLFDSEDLTSYEVASRLLEIAARGSLGERVAVTFSRSTNAEAPDEFQLYPTHGDTGSHGDTGPTS